MNIKCASIYSWMLSKRGEHNMPNVYRSWLKYNKKCLNRCAFRKTLVNVLFFCMFIFLTVDFSSGFCALCWQKTYKFHEGESGSLQIAVERATFLNYLYFPRLPSFFAKHNHIYVCSFNNSNKSHFWVNFFGESEKWKQNEQKIFRGSQYSIYFENYFPYKIEWKAGRDFFIGRKIRGFSCGKNFLNQLWKNTPNISLSSMLLHSWKNRLNFKRLNYRKFK
jgi:hypothetical protein